MIQSPLNYTGGKYRLLSQILPLFPDDIETFAKVDILDDTVNYQGLRHQSQRGIQSGSRSEYKKGHNHRGNIHHQKCRSDIHAGMCL